MNRVLWSMYIFGEFLFRVLHLCPMGQVQKSGKKAFLFWDCVFFHSSMAGGAHTYKTIASPCHDSAFNWFALGVGVRKTKKRMSRCLFHIVPFFIFFCDMLNHERQQYEFRPFFCLQKSLCLHVF